MEIDKDRESEDLDILRQNLKMQTVPAVEKNKPFENEAKTPLFDAKTKSKTRLRMLYESQAETLRKEIGELEEIRLRLGLSKRKICQLLLIDPSSWTRWTSFSGHKVPPHIYRMLQWYLLIEDKYPALGQTYWLQSASHGSNVKIKEEDVERIKKEVQSYQSSMTYEMQKRIYDLEKRIQTNQWIMGFLMLTSLLLLTLRFV